MSIEKKRLIETSKKFDTLSVQTKINVKTTAKSLSFSSIIRRLFVMFTSPFTDKKPKGIIVFYLDHYVHESGTSM